MVPRTLFSPIIFNFGELDSIVIARYCDKRLDKTINLNINSMALQQFMHRLIQVLKKCSLNFFFKVTDCKAIAHS